MTLDGGVKRQQCSTLNAENHLKSAFEASDLALTLKFQGPVSLGGTAPVKDPDPTSCVLDVVVQCSPITP